MMYQAGEGWQYGKRRISAMSNEEFNKLTPQIIMEKQAVVLRNSLETIQKSMNDMTPMIGTIVQQYGDFIREIIANIPQALQNIVAPSSPVPSVPGQYQQRPGTPGFITPITPYIPKFVTPPTGRPAIPLPPPSIVPPQYGPQIGPTPKREIDRDRRIIPTPNPLQKRQQDATDIIYSRSRLKFYKAKLKQLLALSPSRRAGAKYNTELNIVKREIQGYIAEIYQLSQAFFNNYGSYLP